MIACNSLPAVNDITYAEAVPLLASISCPVVKCALGEARLVCIPSGSGSPCLDLSRVSRQCAQVKADLVVLEGMGRAIHTNFTQTFSCDALLLAVVKNPRVARDLGAEMYDSVCLFKPASQPCTLEVSGKQQ